MDTTGLGTRFSMPRQSFGATANATAMGNSSFGFASPAVRMPHPGLHYYVVNNATVDTRQVRQQFNTSDSAAALPFLGTPLPNWGGGGQQFSSREMFPVSTSCLLYTSPSPRD